jgi:hypothetical protein
MAGALQALRDLFSKRDGGTNFCQRIQHTGQLQASSLRQWTFASQPEEVQSSHLLLLDKIETLKPTGGTVGPSTAADAAALGVGATVDFPCGLRPAVGPRGLDLQLQLFRLRLGEPWDGMSPPAATQTDCGQPSLGVAGVADRAAGLLAARLLFPDATAPVLNMLAGAYCAASAVQAAHLLLLPAARAAWRRSGERAPRRGAAATTAARRVGRLGRLLQQYGEPAFVLLAVAALWARMHPTSAQIGECIAGERRVVLPVACTACEHLLVLGASLHAAFKPPLLQRWSPCWSGTTKRRGSAPCGGSAVLRQKRWVRSLPSRLPVVVPGCVSPGVASNSRTSSPLMHCRPAPAGPPSPPHPQLWRKRHKWAARRTAALLSDLPDRVGARSARPPHQPP